MNIPIELYKFCDDIREISPWNIKAIVLIGSFSTGEGSLFKNNANKIEMLSDYDLEVLVKFYNPLLLKRLNERSRNASFKVSIGCIPVDFLSKLKMIQTFDMKTNGLVLIGDKKILEKIPMEKPSDIPAYEGIRRLLNGIMEMNEAIIHYEDANSLLSNQNMKIAYSISKAYLACCTALLTLIGKYRTSFKEREILFSKIFKSHFNKLFEKHPSFPEKISNALKFKLDPSNKLKQFSEDWFEARLHILNTLEYSLSRYFGNSSDLFSLLKNLDKLPRKPLLNIAYVLSSIFLLKKFPLLKSFFLIPMITAQVSGVYLLKSIKKDGSIDKKLLDKALQEINKIYPTVTLRNNWNLIKNLIVRIWKIAPDYSMN